MLPDPNAFTGRIAYVKPLGVIRDGMRFEQEVGRDPRAGHRRRSRLGVLDMARAIADGRPHVATGELGYHVLDVMLSAQESAGTGETLTIDSTVADVPLLPEGSILREHARLSRRWAHAKRGGCREHRIHPSSSPDRRPASRSVTGVRIDDHHGAVGSRAPHPARAERRCGHDRHETRGQKQRNQADRAGRRHGRRPSAMIMTAVVSRRTTATAAARMLARASGQNDERGDADDSDERRRRRGPGEEQAAGGQRRRAPRHPQQSRHGEDDARPAGRARRHVARDGGSAHADRDQTRPPRERHGPGAHGGSRSGRRAGGRAHAVTDRAPRSAPSATPSSTIALARCRKWSGTFSARCSPSADEEESRPRPAADRRRRWWR